MTLSLASVSVGGMIRVRDKDGVMDAGLIVGLDFHLPDRRLSHGRAFF